MNPAYGVGQHQWGAAYFDWTGHSLSRDSAISQEITPIGLAPKSFWSLNWGWAGSTGGGYVGIQTLGSGRNNSDSDIAIFSIWDATQAIAGKDSWCVPFEGEGVGYSCRTALNLRSNASYRVTVFPDQIRGADWWAANVQLPDGTIIYLGSMKAPSLNLSASAFGNFIEYFGPQLKCSEVGDASARFGLLTSQLGSNSGVVRFSRPAEGCVNSWMVLDETWSTKGPQMKFGGQLSPPSESPMEASVTSPPFKATPGNQPQNSGISWKFFGNTLRVKLGGLGLSEESVTVQLNSKSVGAATVTALNSQVRIAEIRFPRAQGVALKLGLSEKSQDFQLVREFKSCKAVWKFYNGGVARSASQAIEETSGKRAATIFTRLYLANSRLDIDSDGVLCER